MGIGYVIEHYIAYFKKEQHEKAYRMYVTDALRILTENSAKQQNGGSYLTVRYAEMIEPVRETRTANEIVLNIKDKLARL